MQKVQLYPQFLAEIEEKTFLLKDLLFMFANPNFLDQQCVATNYQECMKWQVITHNSLNRVTILRWISPCGLIDEILHQSKKK